MKNLACTYVHNNQSKVPETVEPTLNDSSKSEDEGNTSITNDTHQCYGPQRQPGLLGVFHPQVAQNLLHISVLIEKKWFWFYEINEKLQNIYIRRMYGRSCRIEFKISNISCVVFSFSLKYYCLNII